MTNTTDNERATMWIATDETAITFKCPRPKGDKETLAIAKATAGVTSEDDAFFAYMDVCAALGEYSMESTTPPDPSEPDGACEKATSHGSPVGRRPG